MQIFYNQQSFDNFIKGFVFVVNNVTDVFRPFVYDLPVNGTFKKPTADKKNSNNNEICIYYLFNMKEINCDNCCIFILLFMCVTWR